MSILSSDVFHVRITLGIMRALFCYYASVKRTVLLIIEPHNM